MVIYWKRLFYGMHCFMISICDDESQYNDGTNERYLSFIHHKEFEQLKNICAWKTAGIKVTTKYINKSIKYCYHWEKKSDIYQDKVIDFTNEPSMWHSFVKNDSDIQLVTNRFDRNTYCTVSKGNFVYIFSFLRNSSIQSYSATYTCNSLTY